ncbi:2-keto-3-deoxygluconate kinase [Sulfitobacter donghicola DSW-25 = KCTC 12864 = JCM 14565]|nr:2-keto-3-deoxygluconate kinase [Sulfitobacter donghicola DSW-25 = KCTC 12864 = JCM 14565]
MAELAPLDRSGEFKIGYAGDTFNTAWYLAQIAPDIEVDYLTAVGDDTISHEMRSFMQTSGINVTHVQEVSGATVGLYLIHLLNGERSFSYWRGQSAAKQLALNSEKLDQAMDQAELIYFSGITLAILDAQSRENLFSALKRARSAGKTIAFDTNLRPRLWASADEMTETIMHAAAQSDIALPSFDDEAEWFGDDSPEATLDRYAQIGVKRIIVKNNDRPVVYLDHDQRGEILVQPAATVVDSTAAGDSFNAGAIAGILQRNSMPAGITDGCRLARFVVQHKGALVQVSDDALEPQSS